jgi:hypothetical protein
MYIVGCMPALCSHRVRAALLEVPGARSDGAFFFVTPLPTFRTRVFTIVGAPVKPAARRSRYITMVSGRIKEGPPSVAFIGSIPTL